MDWIRSGQNGRVSARTYGLVAILVLTLLVIHNMDEQQKAARARARAAATSPTPAVATLATRSRDALPAEAAAGWGRDPFSRTFLDAGDEVPAGRKFGPKPGPAGAPIYLQGIMVGAMGRTALINGEICREGDRVGSYEVLSIGKRSVMLMKNGSVTTLTIQGDGS
ncbi:MAG TPA: hypothetical protein VJQ53_09205 [Candidatus Eisenbacteria bacterium]|nr:hypothetical protein [Candidatus Eisenbacteria bacterium]